MIEDDNYLSYKLALNQLLMGIEHDELHQRRWAPFVAFLLAAYYP
jgi:hypothetical protein